MAGTVFDHRHAALAVWTAIATLACPAAGWAQIIDQYFPPTGTGIGGTPSDPSRGNALSRYSTEGVRAGSFVIRPDFTEGFGYNSNVQGFSGGKGSSFINAAGSVLAASDWSRDSAYLAATVNDQRYLDVPAESFTNWTAKLGGTIDAGNDKIGLAYSHLNLSQQPGSIDAITVLQPVNYRVDSLQLSYTANDVGRFSFVPELDVSHYDFDTYLAGNRLVSQAYRNRVVVQGDLTTRYELAPQNQLLLVVQGTNITYLNNLPGLPQRDSNGAAVLAGIDYAVPDSVFTLRALAGVQVRNYVSNAYAQLVAPVLEASIVWAPTRLTTFTLTARRDIEDAADESIAGFTYTDARLSVDHELRRNIMLNGFAEVQFADYQSTKLNIVAPGLQEAGTSQVVYDSGASVTWLLNRNLRAALSFQLSQRVGGPAGSNYVSKLGRLTIGFRL